MSISVRSFVRAAVCGLALVSAAGSAGAATITWGSATQITGDSDVITTGTLVGAAHFGGAATTVNGVTFQALATGSASNTVGNYNLSSGFFVGNGTGSAAAPFTGLGTGYKTLLGSAAKSLDAITLTMNGLTTGQQYQFQAWVNDSENFNPPGFTFGVDVTGGANDVVLNPNTSVGDGGLGQYVLGTFTADAASQVVTFFNSEVGVVNGFQLRTAPPVNAGGGGSTVPLPPAAWPGLMLAAGLACSAWPRRRGAARAS